MNAAKNMDSVFSACTESELDFDVMFDDDDSIIDSIAGYDEAGNLLTGEDFDWEAFDALGEADDMVGEKPDFDYPNDEIGSDYEDSKNRDIEMGGEVGDGRTVSGREKSAESQAYDDTKDIDDSIGLNDKQQTKLEAFDILDLMEEYDFMDEADDVELGTMDNIKDTEAEKLVCPACGKNPCECKSTKESYTIIDDLIDMLNEESESPIDDPCDCAQRAGKAGTGISDTEGKDQEIIGAAMDGHTKEDPIADDIDDADARGGKADSVQDTEGKDTHTVGAALEGYEIEADILSLIEAEEAKEEEEDEATEDETEGCCKEDAAEGPLEDDDPAERSGEVSDTTVETEACKKEEADVDAEEDDDDTEEDVKESEFIVDTLLDILDEETEDPIADDIDDEEARSGKADPVKDTEGVDQDPVGAALEASDFLDDIIDAVDPDEQLVPDNINLDDFLLGSEVIQDLVDDSDIKVAKESAEEDVIDDDQDDDAIENIDSESDSEGGADIESGYDDDELIDAIINGDVEDL